MPKTTKFVFHPDYSHKMLANTRIGPQLQSNMRSYKRVDDRRVLSIIVHCHPFRGRRVDSAAADGHKKTLNNLYIRWAERGVWGGIFSAIAGADGAPDRLMIDLTIFNAHRYSGGKKGALTHTFGRSKGGRTTKIHLLTNGQRRPCLTAISPGNTSDYKASKQALAAMPPAAEVIADKGYDCDDVRYWLQESGATPAIARRSNREVQYEYD
jgi:transposase